MAFASPLYNKLSIGPCSCTNRHCATPCPGVRPAARVSGFVCPGNPFDRIVLSGLQLPPGCRMSRDAATAAAKEAAAAAAATAAGLGVGLAGPGWGSPPAATGRRATAAAASLVAAFGWRNMREYWSVSEESTAACVAAAGACMRRQLEAFPTTWQQDMDMLDGSGGGKGSSQRRRAAAVQYRLEQKLLLLAGLDVLERIRA